MLFQYNPLDYYIETDQNRELIVTINRLTVLSPRIRYNIHDLGGTVSFEQMLHHLGAHGLDPLGACRQPGRPVFRLPFLYLFGRSDQTISYMGANIYPEDVEQALFSVPEDREQRPCVHVEVTGGAVEDLMLADRLRERVLARLLANSLDFRSAVSEDESAGELLVRLHSPRQGPFAANAHRIKRRYLVPPPSPLP
jgi:phenylacetate-CoA ligase